jgi:hypothetical protein
MISKTKLLRSPSFSLRNSKASVLEQHCTYYLSLFYSMLKLHDRCKLAHTYARELLECLIDYSLVTLSVEWLGIFG